MYLSTWDRKILPNNDRLILDLSYEIEFDILMQPAYFPTPQACQSEAEYRRQHRLYQTRGVTREQLAEAYALASVRHSQR